MPHWLLDKRQLQQTVDVLRDDQRWNITKDIYSNFRLWFISKHMNSQTISGFVINEFIHSSPSSQRHVTFVSQFEYLLKRQRTRLYTIHWMWWQNHFKALCSAQTALCLPATKLFQHILNVPLLFSSIVSISVSVVAYYYKTMSYQTEQVFSAEVVRNLLLNWCRIYQVNIHALMVNRGN